MLLTIEHKIDRQKQAEEEETCWRPAGFLIRDSAVSSEKINVTQQQQKPTKTTKKSKNKKPLKYELTPILRRTFLEADQDKLNGWIQQGRNIIEEDLK